MAKQPEKKHQVRRVIEQLTSTPWAIDVAKLEEIQGLLELRATGQLFTAEELRERLGAAGVDRAMDSDDESEEPYALTADGVAVIPLYGVMTPRANMVSRFSGGTSTSLFTAAVREAAADPNVKAIVLDVDSPGGVVQGTEEAAQAVRAARAVKPVIAVATNEMCSAAYYVGSAAADVVASPSAMVGSIGVYTIHIDRSRAYENAGVKPTLIRAGKFKADGIDIQPLGEQARETIQERVDYAYTMFTAAVAANRGVSPQTVVEKFGGGKVFYAAKAVEAGLADRVGTLDQVLAELGAKLRGAAGAQSASFSRETAMDKEILQAMIGLGLVAAEATEAHAEAVLAGWYAGRGQARPEKKDAVLADLKSGNAQRPPAAGGTPAASGTPATTPTTAKTTETVEGTQDSQAAVRAERERIKQIQARGDTLGVSAEVIQQAIDSGATLAAFLDQATADLAKNHKPVAKIDAGPAAVEKYHDAAVEAICRRAGMQVEGAVSQGARDLQHFSLVELATEGLRMRGAKRLRGVDKDTIAQAALGSPEALSILGGDVPYATPGDFPNVLSAMARKALDTAPPYVGTTYQKWAARRPSVPDFKPATLVRIGEFGEFPLHVDGDDFEQSKPSEEQSWIQVDSYGDEFGLTPKMIVDDDLAAFTEALTDKQAAHEQTINRLCVNLLVGNVVCSDGVALFDDASHGNDRTSGAAPSTTELSAMRLKLRQQTGVSAKRKLNFTLFGLLIPEALETTTQQLLAATLQINPTTESNTPVFKGQVDWWVEPMLTDYSAQMYYGFANPQLARSIVYCFQTGFENMKTRNYFNPKNNCRIFQFEGRFAAAANHHRGIIRNAGK